MEKLKIAMDRYFYGEGELYDGDEVREYLIENGVNVDAMWRELNAVLVKHARMAK